MMPEEKAETLVLPDNIRTRYTYNAQSQLTRMETGSGDVFQFAYDEVGRPNTPRIS